MRDFFIKCLAPITPISKMPIIRITMESSRREKADLELELVFSLRDFLFIGFGMNLI